MEEYEVSIQSRSRLIESLTASSQTGRRVERSRVEDDGLARELRNGSRIYSERWKLDAVGSLRNSVEKLE